MSIACAVWILVHSIRQMPDLMPMMKAAWTIFALMHLEKVKPMWSGAKDQLNNHVWILGDTSKISWAAQADNDLPLNPKEGGN